ncbi:hypothetical protein D3C84_768510 [compost metagenome]
MIARNIEIEIRQVVERDRGLLGRHFKFRLGSWRFEHRLGRKVRYLNFWRRLAKLQRLVQIQTLQVIVQTQVEGAVQVILGQRLQCRLQLRLQLGDRCRLWLWL